MDWPINKLKFTDLGVASGILGREDAQSMWYPWAASWVQGMTVLDVGSGVSNPKAMVAMGVKSVTTQEPGPGCPADIKSAVEDVRGLWDAATCFDVIEHVVDYGRFVGHLARIARKKVIITTPGVQVTRNSHVYHYHEFLANEVVQLFGAAGMQLEAVRFYTETGLMDRTGQAAYRLCAEEPVVSPMGFVFTHD